MKEWDQVWNQREVLYRVKLWLWLCGVEGMKQQMDSVVLKEQQVPVVKTAAGGCSAKPSRVCRDNRETLLLLFCDLCCSNIPKVLVWNCWITIISSNINRTLHSIIHCSTA